MAKRGYQRKLGYILVLGLLAGCAGTPIGDSLQQSLEADPQLEESPPFGDRPSEEELSPASTEEMEETAEGERDEIATTADIDENVDADEEPEEDVEQSPEADQKNETANRDLTGVPQDLQTYVRDLQALGLLEVSGKTDDPASDAKETSQSPFTEPITRQEYARWLFNSYNTIYADEPGDRLRPGTPTDEPAFQDVDPDSPAFGAIQGLAEAGIIPSAFTGNSTDVNFRPEAPLTREDLILWKVPLDARASLPTTTPEAVTSTWGFQDTASIDPQALRAIAADFQLGDFANIRRAFGYTTLFRPEKAVSRAEAAAVLWRFGNQTEGRTAADVQSANRRSEG